MVIEAAGLRFVAEREQVALVSGLRLEVEEGHGGRKVLVATHETWAPGSCC